MKILVINCGSSSLKYQLINPETEEVFAKGRFSDSAIQRYAVWVLLSFFADCAREKWK